MYRITHTFTKFDSLFLLDLYFYINFKCYNIYIYIYLSYNFKVCFFRDNFKVCCIHIFVSYYICVSRPIRAFLAAGLSRHHNF